MSDGKGTGMVKGQENEEQKQQQSQRFMARTEGSGNLTTVADEERSESQHGSMFGRSLRGASVNIANFADETFPEKVVLATEQVSSEQGSQNITFDVTELKKEKVRLEHVLFLTNGELDAVRNKLYRVSEAQNALKKENEELLRDRSQRMAAIRELEAERDRILLAKNECEQKAEMLLRQKEDYEGKINRLHHDKSLIASDLQLQKNEVAKLIEKNVLLDTKLDEYAKQKRIVEYEKERWAQEKEIYLHNKDWFMNEIKERDRKFAVLRIEMVRYTGELQAEIASVTDKYECAMNDVKKLTGALADRNKEIPRLNDRIKGILEDNAQKLNKLEEELLASERLCSVYKEASDDAENNLRQLNEDFDNRGKLLEESKKAYESLCTEFEEKQAAFTKEVVQKDKKIEELVDELQKANDLLKSRHRVTLTDDEIMELSPAAAAASSLIRSGVSLTSIYREHCRVVAELEEAKAENKRIEKYFHELVEDIEAKAPLLAQQRIEYEKISDLCNNLQEQLQSAEQERLKLENARDAATRELTYTRAELERYQRDVEDLSRQVRHLLHASEVERARNTDSPPMNDEDRDVLWNSIGEMQKVNQKLMSDLRTINANRDRAVEEAKSEEINRLTDALDDAIKKLDFLKDENSKQNMVIEELEKQRDTYKKVGSERKTLEESHTLIKRMQEIESKNAILRVHLERAEKSLDLFREEKHHSDELLQARIDQQFALIAELRKTNGKLEADIEVQRQTQLMLTKQSENDSNELSLAREKYIKMDNNYKMADERCRKLQEELMETKGEVAKYKTDVEALMEQVSLLRSTEARLQQELHILRESNYSNEKMSATLKQLENRLQHNDEEKVKILESQLELAKNENESLKKFVSEISEQHRLISLDLKMTTNKIQTERDQALASKKSAEERLTWKDKELSELQTKYDDLMSQLKTPDSSLESTDGGCKKEAQQLRNRNSYLENQLKDMCHKLEASEKMLAIREQELNEINKLSNNMETTLLEQGASALAERNSLQAMLDLVKGQLAESVKAVENQRTEIALLEQKLQEKATETEQLKIEKMKEYQGLEKRCSVLDIQRANAEARIHELELENTKIAAAKVSFDEESSRMKEDISKLEQALRVKDAEVVNLKNTAVGLEQKSEDVRRSCSSEVAALRVEKNQFEEELSLANKLIDEQKQKLEELGDNLIKVTERMAVLERSGSASTSSEDVAPVGSKSAVAMYEVIKYLQGENRQAMERMMNAELQWKRLQVQQATADENRLKLEEEIQKLRREAEAHVRSIAEKSEMVARLTLMEDIQKENQNIKLQNEKLTRHNEQLSKNINDLQVRIASLGAEKVTEKGRLQNVCADLQTCRKELESWKERHNQALISLGKFGPERIVALNNEVESLKRRLSVITTERDSLKREIEKSQESTFKEALVDVQKKFDESESERLKLSAKFEQARLLARRYRMKSQTLEKDVEGLKAILAEKSIVEEENTTETAKLRQELLALRAEIEKQKQQKVVPRTGWPVDAGTGGTQPTKASTILQTQLKQLEGLNQQNKDLSKQLEESAERYKVAQAKLSEAEAKFREMKTESDTKEELRFRLNSITSMLTKKEQEVARLREELETAKQSDEAYQGKIKVLEATLDICRKEASNRHGFSGTAFVKSVSSSTPVISQSQSSPTDALPATNTAGPDFSPLSKEETPTTSQSMPLVKPAATVDATQNEKYEDAKQKVAIVGSIEEQETHRSTPVSTTSEQSNTVSQSSSGDIIQVRLQQHNVTSGNGDGANIITSSVASGDIPTAIQGIVSQVGPQSILITRNENEPSRKRTYIPSSDQIETGSDVLEPRKRYRGSPMGQVSTSGRFIKSGSESRIDIEQHATDEAEHEQQESVETTTNPEGDRSDVMRTNEAEKNTKSASEVQEASADVSYETVGEGLAQEEGHAEEQMEDNGHDVIVGEDIGREASADEDNLSEEAGDEMLEEMEDEEFDEEEPDEEGDFDLPPNYRRSDYRSSRARQHLESVNDGDEDDGVILIEDEDDGEMEHSHSPADLSMDEAHGEDRKRSVVVDDDLETSTAEARERQNVQGETIRRMELSLKTAAEQSSATSHMDSSTSQGFVADRTGEGDASRSEHYSSEALYVPVAELDLQPHSLNTASQEGGDVVSGSELHVVRDSPPLIENIESDSRGASSTVAPITGTDVDSGESEHALMIEEGGNDVAEEEQGDRHATQTDDEAASSGPSTSDGSTTRRIRIRYPDITEPTSSSSDATHQSSGSMQRGGRATLLRRGRGYRM
ncbi:viral A-type inclusion protein repeat containing protein [Loa loa]|uniref:Viral A-type inclusion protein repeat containing protein n=1 Tax=Loa loa TaxID=7209 RepID=A0A1I7VFT3_LOALO|nr:viral A-type inclusion protein repeat containing protein [Loa loa]EJD73977.1 viral A-type inclusion protein repeat containing protein [Loa loa]